MTIYGGWISGIAPKKIDHIKKVIESRCLNKDFKRYGQEFIDLQINNNLTYITESQYKWRDLSYIFEELDNVENLEPISLHGGRLCIYRKVFKDKPDISQKILVNMFDRRIREETNWKFSMLGPYSMYRLSYISNYDKEKLIRELYEKVFEEAIEEGFSAIDLHEPFIGYDDGNDKVLVKRIYSIIDSFPSIKFFIFPYVDDYRRSLSLLIEISRDGFVIDMNYTEIYDLIPLPLDRVILGIDDLLTEDNIHQFISNIKRLTREIRYKEIDFTYPYSISTISYPAMIRKIRLIGLLLKVLGNE